ncbi:uncharacterized protein [Amphiura filiformis]|uniref:uncharacterized protein n=1 Tax=Amphiura filiformis TaxID=82378 RepID=UPI003B21DF7B
MKPRRSEVAPSSGTTKSKWFDEKQATKETQSKYLITERKSSQEDSKQISEMTDRLRNTKVRDVSTRAQASGKRSGRRNTPVPMPVGKTNYRHGSVTASRNKAPRPPDLIEGKSLLDKSSTTKRDSRPARTRAFSDSTWRDVDMIRAANRDHGLMLKKTGIKSVLPPMASGPLYGRRALPPGERLRPLAMPTAEIGGPSKVFASRQSSDKDPKSRMPKSKGVVRRSRTMGDLNSKIAPVQGVKPKMTHKSSKTKLIEVSAADFTPKVPHSSPTDTTMTSSDSSTSTSSMHSDRQDELTFDTNKCPTEHIVTSISLDSLSKIAKISEETNPFPIFVTESLIAPIGAKQPLGQIPTVTEDPNSLPALPVIRFRPATPLPRDTADTDESMSAALGNLLRKTVCQAAIRQKELEQLMGDIDEINTNLQTQVIPSVVES